MVTMGGMRHEDHSKLIDMLGGTVEVARLCQVSSQAVSKWRNEGIPHARLMYLKLARPEVFGGGDPVDSTIAPERRADGRRDHERRDGERRDSERRGGKGAA